jgi:hypothetical protein
MYLLSISKHLPEKKTIAIANPVVPEVNAIKKELEEFKNAILNNTKDDRIGDGWINGYGGGSPDIRQNR